MQCVRIRKEFRTLLNFTLKIVEYFYRISIQNNAYEFDKRAGRRNHKPVNKNFVTLQVFQYSSEAQIIKGRLEAEGIPVFLRDEFTIDTDPFLSQAIGGVKLRVEEKDEAKAREVLNDISTYSFDDAGEALHCPNCDSTKIDYVTTVRDAKSIAAFALSILVVALPIHTKYEYRCEECKTKF